MVTMRWRRTQATAPDPRVAAVLAAAAAPTEPGPQPGEAAALVAFRSAASTPNRRTRMFPSLKAAAIAATATGALLTGGVAAAATGALPGAAQDTARTMLGTVGVTVPGPADAAGTHPATRGGSAATATETTAPAAAPATTAATKGEAVSELATTTELTGRDKGAAISDLASEGRSKAGLPHPTPTTTTTATTTTGADASSTGRSTAATASAGHSSTGTAHRP
jgi:hypothetical protein